MDRSLITREAPTHRRSSYDPNARRIALAPGSTPYVLAHERAHEAQHRYRTLLWRLHAAVPSWIPYLHRLTQVLVELEANRLALGALRHAGRLDALARAEGRNCVRYYLCRLLWTPRPSRAFLEL